MESSAAQKAKLQKGDKVMQINGQDTKGMSSFDVVRHQYIVVAFTECKRRKQNTSMYIRMHTQACTLKQTYEHSSVRHYC
jgi:C-terminal processing protease CtpA/Prc